MSIRWTDESYKNKDLWYDCQYYRGKYSFHQWAKFILYISAIEDRYHKISNYLKDKPTACLILEQNTIIPDSKQQQEPKTSSRLFHTHKKNTEPYHWQLNVVTKHKNGIWNIYAHLIRKWVIQSNKSKINWQRHRKTTSIWITPFFVQH